MKKLFTNVPAIFMAAVLVGFSVFLFSTITYAITESCVISGVVRDAEGLPIPDINVRLDDVLCWDGFSFESLFHCSEDTNEAGLFQLLVYPFDDRQILPGWSGVLDVTLGAPTLDYKKRHAFTCGASNAIDIGRLYQIDSAWLVRREDGNDKKHDTVLLVHGLRALPPRRCGRNGGEGTWHNMAPLLGQEGFSVWEFQYITKDRIRENALLLSDAVRLLRELTGEAPVRIVAHSLGGLVARYYLQNFYENDGAIAQLVTLGTPYHGVHGRCRIISCHKRRALKPNGNFLTRLNSVVLPNLESGGEDYVFMGGRRASFPICASRKTSDGVVTLESALWPARGGQYQWTALEGYGHGDMVAVDSIMHRGYQHILAALKNDALFFDFALDSFIVAGNIENYCSSIPISFFVDGFSDGSLWDCPTNLFFWPIAVSESDGFLQMTSANGATINRQCGKYYDTAVFGALFIKGNGDAIIVAKFRADKPSRHRFYGLSIQGNSFGWVAEGVGIWVHRIDRDVLVVSRNVFVDGKYIVVTEAPISLWLKRRIRLQLLLDGETGYVRTRYRIGKNPYAEIVSSDDPDYQGGIFGISYRAYAYVSGGISPPVVDEICDDGIDNDCDGFTDWLDDDCLDGGEF